MLGKKLFFVGVLNVTDEKSTVGSGAGSHCLRFRSEDPDPHTDQYQNGAGSGKLFYAEDENSLICINKIENFVLQDNQKNVELQRHSFLSSSTYSYSTIEQDIVSLVQQPLESKFRIRQN